MFGKQRILGITLFSLSMSACGAYDPSGHGQPGPQHASGSAVEDLAAEDGSTVDGERTALDSAPVDLAASASIDDPVDVGEEPEGYEPDESDPNLASVVGLTAIETFERDKLARAEAAVNADETANKGSASEEPSDGVGMKTSALVTKRTVLRLYQGSQWSTALGCSSHGI